MGRQLFQRAGRGGYDCDGRGLSIWDVKQLNEGTRCSFHYASDFYHHWKEDIALYGGNGIQSIQDVHFLEPYPA